MYKIQPKTLFVGQTLIYLPSCQSTNDEASACIARSSGPEGTLVVTDRQTAGRGQRGSIWEAQPGQNLTISLILRPSFLKATEQFQLNMAVSLGLYDTLQPLLGGHPLRIKWPNDLYVGDRKLGGILIENTIQGYNLAWSVVGMGLNVNQTGFAYPTATSLQQLVPLPEGYDLPGLLTQLCEKFEPRYWQLRAGAVGTLNAAYEQTLYRKGEEAWYEADGVRFRGTITGVDASGRLLMETATGTRSFGFKDVKFITMNDE